MRSRVLVEIEFDCDDPEEARDSVVAGLPCLVSWLGGPGVEYRIVNVESASDEEIR
jgi:hypothetical protein